MPDLIDAYITRTKFQYEYSSQLLARDSFVTAYLRIVQESYVVNRPYVVPKEKFKKYYSYAAKTRHKINCLVQSHS